MQKYRHIPVVVEAIQLTKDNAEEVANWCNGRVVEEQNPTDPEDIYIAVDFPTFDGTKRLAMGQYIAKALNGRGFTRHNAGFFESMFIPEKPMNPLGHSHIPGARTI